MGAGQRRRADLAIAAAAAPRDKCPICDAELADTPWEFDHFPVPYLDGGTDLVPLCKSCHSCLDRTGMRKISPLVVDEIRGLIGRRLGPERLASLVSARSFSDFALSIGVSAPEHWGSGSHGLTRLERMSAFMVVKERRGALVQHKLAADTLEGQRRRFLAGFAAGGVPYGYRTERVRLESDDASKIVVDEGAAAVVASIFKMRAEGKSLQEIADAMTSASVPMPKPRREKMCDGWSLSAVRNMVKNRRYIGEWAFGESVWERDTTGKRRKRHRVGPVASLSRPDLAIISLELWERANVIKLPKVRTLRSPRLRKSWPLSGVLVCGDCGRHLEIVGGHRGKRYYKCSGARDRLCVATACHAESEIRSEVVATAMPGTCVDGLSPAELKERLRAALPGGVFVVPAESAKSARAAA